MTPNQLKSSLLCSCLHGKTIDCYSKTCAKDEIDETYILNDVDEEPYAIPENWVWVRLGDIISFIGGSQPPKTKFIYEEKEGYTRLIQIRDFKTDAYKVYIPTDSTKKFFTSTDIMIGRYGPPIFQILRGLEGAYNVALMKAEPHINIDKDFMYYLLQDPVLFNALVQKSNRCCGQDGIDMPTLKEYIVGLPPLEDQRSIVDKIEELLPYVNRYAEAYDKLEQFNAKFPEDMKKSILQYAIQGKLVKQIPEEGEVDLSRIKNKKTEEIGYDIPETWGVAHLESVTKVIASKQYQIPASEFKKSGKYPVISQSKDYIIGYSDDEEKLYHHDNPIIAFGDHTTEVKYVDFDFVVGADGIKIFEPDTTVVSAKFLEYVMSFYSIGLDKVGGYSRHYKYIKDKPIPIPPLKEQERIVSKIEELLPLCERLVK